MAQACKTKQSFVSPWCHLPKASKGFSFASKIKSQVVECRLTAEPFATTLFQSTIGNDTGGLF
jgi:hypothetical protein